MDDLAISAAWPVYDKNGSLHGVMGTHMLLSDNGDFITVKVHKYDGYAVIIEKDMGAFIANSMGMENYRIHQDGSFERTMIDENDNPDLHKAYMKFLEDGGSGFILKGDKGQFHMNARELDMEGIDWIVISAIPVKYYMDSVVNGIHMTGIIVATALLLSILMYNAITGVLFRPMEELLRVSSSLASGDLSKRVEIRRNDELGMISEGLNTVADRMQYHINNLEENVRIRTEELHRLNRALEENTNRLQLILDSTAEAIYGFDLDGRCTFCNNSCLRLLGYESQEDLLGKYMHRQIHHSRRDGREFPIEECRIIQSVRQGRGFTADDEVFWRADGTCFDVEYHSYPQIKDGKVVGGVITFMDITERKKREERIRYLSYHDAITGLHNRRYIEENLASINTADSLPFSVIYADINGLKLTNDIFGHSAGDELIRKSAEILTGVCRENDMIARVGGDEFIIFLPGTDKEEAGKLLAQIRLGFSDARIEAVKCSISLGTDTRTSMKQTLEEVMINAENAMYIDKLTNRKFENKHIIDNIIETLHSRSAAEKQHSETVGELCAEIGAALGLPENEISKLRRAGYLHDIGKIIMDESSLVKDVLSEHEKEKVRQHPAVGFRILNLFDDTLDLAEYVYGHHEKRDGSGYPRGLAGEQIPLGSRIISVVEICERMLRRGDLPPEERKRRAIEEIREGAGNRYDPKIAELFVRIIERKDGEASQNPSS